eukprot:Skav222829  [mRNA]  locus=scaffold4760:104276:110200:- [translate_table: standard]
MLDRLSGELVFVRHLGHLQALCRAPKLHTTRYKLFHIDQTIAVCVNHHEQTPRVVGGNAQGFEKCSQLLFCQGFFKIFDAHCVDVSLVHLLKDLLQ